MVLKAENKVSSTQNKDSNNSVISIIDGSNVCGQGNNKTAGVFSNNNLCNDLNLISAKKGSERFKISNTKQENIGNEDILTNIFVVSSNRKYATKIKEFIDKPLFGINCYAIDSLSAFIAKIKLFDCHVLYLDANKENIKEMMEMVSAIKESVLSMGILVSLDSRTFVDEAEIQLYETKLISVGVESVLRRPFGVNIFVGYINLVLRIVRGYSNNKYNMGILTFICDKYKVYFYNKEVKLTKVQFCVVYSLFMEYGKIIHKDDLLKKIGLYEQAWQIPGATESITKSLNYKSLDVALCRIRESFRETRLSVLKSYLFNIQTSTSGKILNEKDVPKIDERITTVWGRGYAIYPMFENGENKFVNTKDNVLSLHLNEGIRITYSEEKVKSIDKALYTMTSTI